LSYVFYGTVIDYEYLLNIVYSKFVVTTANSRIFAIQ